MATDAEETIAKERINRAMLSFIYSLKAYERASNSRLFETFANANRELTADYHPIELMMMFHEEAMVQLENFDFSANPDELKYFRLIKYHGYEQDNFPIARPRSVEPTAGASSHYRPPSTIMSAEEALRTMTDDQFEEYRLFLKMERTQNRITPIDVCMSYVVASAAELSDGVLLARIEIQKRLVEQRAGRRPQHQRSDKDEELVRAYAARITERRRREQMPHQAQPAAASSSSSFTSSNILAISTPLLQPNAQRPDDFRTYENDVQRINEIQAYEQRRRDRIRREELDRRSFARGRNMSRPPRRTRRVSGALPDYLLRPKLGRVVSAKKRTTTTTTTRTSQQSSSSSRSRSSNSSSSSGLHF